MKLVGPSYPIPTSIRFQGQPILFASFNYRLGALGFLASTDIAAAAAAGTASLNSGLYDIQFALQWIQNNIAGFGGDNNKVTGRSASCSPVGKYGSVYSFNV
jgi:acetylcholinesterase